jgi:hypothetical protein
MTRSDDTLSGRAPTLTLEGVEMVCVDRQTLEKVLELVGVSFDSLTNANDCEVMLFALENYLTKEADPDSDRALLFLRYWLHVVPEWTEEILTNLDEVYTLLKTVLESTKQTP